MDSKEREKRLGWYSVVLAYNRLSSAQDRGSKEMLFNEFIQVFDGFVTENPHPFGEVSASDKITEERECTASISAQTGTEPSFDLPKTQSEDCEATITQVEKTLQDIDSFITLGETELAVYETQSVPPSMQTLVKHKSKLEKLRNLRKTAKARLSFLCEERVAIT